jgi:hypothetical protein
MTHRVPMATLDEQRAELLRYVSGLKSEIVQQVSIARLTQGLSEQQEAFATQLVEQFDSLSRDAGQADKPTLDILRDRADTLDASRIFFMTPAEMRATARARLSEMRDWAIPDAWLQDVSQIVTEMQAADWKPDPYAFKRVEKEYVYWDDYTDWYFGRMTQISVGLFVTTVLALLLAFVAFRDVGVFWGFIAAGVAGTGVSILLKLPPMSVYGTVAPLGGQICVRYAAGLVGVTVGAGFLALGLFTIKLPGDRDLSTILEMYARNSSATDPSLAPTSAKRIDAHTNLRAETSTKNPPSTDSADNHLSLLILMSVGLLLGFSERSLTSFETTLFGSPTSMK